MRYVVCETFVIYIGASAAFFNLLFLDG